MPLSDGSGRRITGIFARADHPVGWGGPGPDGGAGPAHGYVVLLVDCADGGELTRVCERLRTQPFLGLDREGGTYLDGYLGQWFGGRFALVATCPEGDVSPDAGQRFQCRGDNRMVAHYAAYEVLA